MNQLKDTSNHTIESADDQLKTMAIRYSFWLLICGTAWGGAVLGTASQFSKYKTNQAVQRIIDECSYSRELNVEIKPHAIPTIVGYHVTLPYFLSPEDKIWLELNICKPDC